MEIVENEAGGQTVILTGGDELSQVPRSHRRLITASIREAFADTGTYFRSTSDRCPFPQMAKWLRAVLAEGRWELQLNRGWGKHASAGFYWRSEEVRGAMIAPPCGRVTTAYPDDLCRYYSLVDAVIWTGFGVAGGLRGVGKHPPLRAYRLDCHGAEVDLKKTFIWGQSLPGDMLIYTADGRGGWLNHGSHQIHLLGTIADPIDWVFSELLAGRRPEWDHDKWDRSAA